MIWPVMNLPAGEASKRAGPAMSSGMAEPAQRRRGLAAGPALGIFVKHARELGHDEPRRDAIPRGIPSGPQAAARLRASA